MTSTTDTKTKNSPQNIQFLFDKSQWLRREIFNMVIRQQTGHIPSSFSCIEILCSLYYGGVANCPADNPNHPNRDRIFMSKGHAAMAQYPILADLGYFPEEELNHFTESGHLLGMYADFRIPGIEGISGSLGHGIGLGAGIAIAARHDNQNHRSFVRVGDGECNEGSIWESALFASHHNLDNLVAIVDRNKLCILGETEKLLKLGDLESKWNSFGWHAVTVDGHSYKSIFEGFSQIGNTNGKPLVLIADTIKGKGISFMEGESKWHNRMPSEEQTAQALNDLSNNPICS